MLPIIWSAEADEDLDKIIDYIGQHNPRAAVKLWDAIVNRVEQLAHNPYLYQASQRVAGCREIVAHPNYIVFYEVEIDCIRIMRVVHARREYPN